MSLVILFNVDLRIAAVVVGDVLVEVEGDDDVELEDVFFMRLINGFGLAISGLGMCEPAQFFLGFGTGAGGVVLVSSLLSSGSLNFSILNSSLSMSSILSVKRINRRYISSWLLFRTEFSPSGNFSLLLQTPANDSTTTRSESLFFLLRYRSVRRSVGKGNEG